MTMNDENEMRAGDICKEIALVLGERYPGMMVEEEDSIKLTLDNGACFEICVKQCNGQ